LSRKTTLSALRQWVAEEDARLAELGPQRRRLEDGPPAQWELMGVRWRVARAEVDLMRALLQMRAWGLSRDEALFALDHLREALESER
jgi:hypothetical protein